MVLCLLLVRQQLEEPLLAGLVQLAQLGMTVASRRRVEELFHLLPGFLLVLRGLFLLFVGQLELRGDRAC